MKLAASKVDFRSGCEVGVKVVFAAPEVTTVGVDVGGGGGVVDLAVELDGTGVVVGTEQDSVMFTRVQLFAVELFEQ